MRAGNFSGAVRGAVRAGWELCLSRTGVALPPGPCRRGFSRRSPACLPTLVTPLSRSARWDGLWRSTLENKTPEDPEPSDKKRCSTHERVSSVPSERSQAQKLGLL